MIGRGTHVKITAGEYAGCFGVVRVLWIDDDWRTVLSVEFWNGKAGRFQIGLFDPHLIEPHQLPPVSRENFDLLAVEQELEAA
jgi:hypothetical protein